MPSCDTKKKNLHVLEIIKRKKKLKLNANKKQILVIDKRDEP